MLAGLCNLCDEYGHKNFENNFAVIREIEIASRQSLRDIKDNIAKYQRHLKTNFSKQAARKSPCQELCILYAFGECNDDHSSCSQDAIALYEVHEKLQNTVTNLEREDLKVRLMEELKEVMDLHTKYVSHLLRTRHQGDYFKYILSNLQPGEAVVVIDYKMKIELGMRTRGIQREWYGKRGISLHGFLVTAKYHDGTKKSDVIDLWSEDTKQDAWFSQSALDVGFKWVEANLPGFHVYLFSDNGPHYHNTSFLMHLAEVNSKFNLRLIEYDYFEAGEGKSALDTHFAHISHKIVRWVRVGNNLETGQQLGDLIGSMKNVTCRKLIIDRSRAPKKMGTLKDISLYGSYSFPTSGVHEGGLVAKSLTGIGKKLEKTKIQLQKLSCREVAVAGETGAKVSEEFPPSTNAGNGITHGLSHSGYSLNFTQHPPEVSSPLLMKHLHPQMRMKLPKSGYGIKKGDGSRVTFSQAQKDIMIEYYNRQANYGVRAEPRDVIKEMEERGVDVLKDTQIRSWWSSYHQKKKKGNAKDG